MKKTTFLECLFIDPTTGYVKTVHGSIKCNKLCEKLNLGGGRCLVDDDCDAVFCTCYNSPSTTSSRCKKKKPLGSTESNKKMNLLI